MQTTSSSLSAAGIIKIQDAEQRLSTIASHIKQEGPQLIVHLVNWYFYHPENMKKSLFWNGDAGKGSEKITLASKPVFGYYSCDDPHYIDWVLSFSKALGITELNIDYEGGVEVSEEFQEYFSKRHWDTWFPALLSRAKNYSVKISVMYEPKSILGRLSEKSDKTPSEIILDSSYPETLIKILKSDLKKICDLFTVNINNQNKIEINPAYKRVAGLPVIWVFNVTASHLTPELWKQAVQELKSEGYVFVLVGTTNGEIFSGYDTVFQGSNPWFNQLFSGIMDHYPEQWTAAQQASKIGDINTAKKIFHQYFQTLEKNGLLADSRIRVLTNPENFTVMPIALGFQDAAVNGWELRPPVYFESHDRTHTDPGLLFRAYFQAAKDLNLTWHMICSGDDICEGTHMLIPDETYGFSGPIAIAQTAKHLGRKPDMKKAIEVTERFIRQQNNGLIPVAIRTILDEAKNINI